MPRPKAIHPRERIHLYLRPEIIATLRILFATEENVHGIIQGAISRFVEVAVEEKIERIKCASQSVSSTTELQTSVLSDLKLETTP